MSVIIIIIIIIILGRGRASTHTERLPVLRTWLSGSLGQYIGH